MLLETVLGNLEWKIFVVTQLWGVTFKFCSYFPQENSRIIFQKLNWTLTQILKNDD